MASREFPPGDKDKKKEGAKSFADAFGSVEAQDTIQRMNEQQAAQSQKSEEENATKPKAPRKAAPRKPRERKPKDPPLAPEFEEVVRRVNELAKIASSAPEGSAERAEAKARIGMNEEKLKEIVRAKAASDAQSEAAIRRSLETKARVWQANGGSAPEDFTRPPKKKPSAAVMRETNMRAAMHADAAKEYEARKDAPRLEALASSDPVDDSGWAEAITASEQKKALADKVRALAEFTTSKEALEATAASTQKAYEEALTKYQSKGGVFRAVARTVRGSLGDELPAHIRELRDKADRAKDALNSRVQGSVELRRSEASKKYKYTKEQLEERYKRRVEKRLVIDAEKAEDKAKQAGIEARKSTALGRAYEWYKNNTTEKGRVLTGSAITMAVALGLAAPTAAGIGAALIFGGTPAALRFMEASFKDPFTKKRLGYYANLFSVGGLFGKYTEKAFRFASKDNLNKAKATLGKTSGFEELAKEGGLRELMRERRDARGMEQTVRNQAAIVRSLASITAGVAFGGIIRGGGVDAHHLQGLAENGGQPPSDEITITSTRYPDAPPPPSDSEIVADAPGTLDLPPPERSITYPPAPPAPNIVADPPGSFDLPPADRTIDYPPERQVEAYNGRKYPGPFNDNGVDPVAEAPSVDGIVPNQEPAPEVAPSAPWQPGIAPPEGTPPEVSPVPPAEIPTDMREVSEEISAITHNAGPAGSPFGGVPSPTDAVPPVDDMWKSAPPGASSAAAGGAGENPFGRIPTPTDSVPMADDLNKPSPADLKDMQDSYRNAGIRQGIADIGAGIDRSVDSIGSSISDAAESAGNRAESIFNQAVSDAQWLAEHTAAVPNGKGFISIIDNLRESLEKTYGSWDELRPSERAYLMEKAPAIAEFMQADTNAEYAKLADKYGFENNPVVPKGTTYGLTPDGRLMEDTGAGLPQERVPKLDAAVPAPKPDSINADLAAPDAAPGDSSRLAYNPETGQSFDPDRPQESYERPSASTPEAPAANAFDGATESVDPGEGGIEVSKDLQARLRAEGYSGPLTEMTPEQFAKTYGLYDPGADAGPGRVGPESAKLYPNERFGVSANGDVYFEDYRGTRSYLTPERNFKFHYPERFIDTNAVPVSAPEEAAPSLERAAPVRSGIDAETRAADAETARLNREYNPTAFDSTPPPEPAPRSTPPPIEAPPAPEPREYQPTTPAPVEVPPPAPAYDYQPSPEPAAPVVAPEPSPVQSAPEAAPDSAPSAEGVFVNSHGVEIQPGNAAVYLDKNNVAIAYGGTAAERFEEARRYVADHPNTEVFLDSSRTNPQTGVNEVHLSRVNAQNANMLSLRGNETIPWSVLENGLNGWPLPSAEDLYKKVADYNQPAIS